MPHPHNEHRERDRAGDARDDAGHRRDLVGDKRDLAGDVRDDAGHQRDLAGDVRDLEGEARDRAAEQRDVAAAADRRRAREDRQAGAAARISAEQDRGIASADRHAGADERARSEADRGTSSDDRSASARQRENTSLDALTLAYLRGPGLVELDREIARARREDNPLVLVLAFIDVDGLKAVNDGEGHAAGDALLRGVSDAFRANMRPYDLLIRYGGDEFLWVLTEPTVKDAQDRVELVQERLTPTVTVGLAQLEPGDVADDLIGRADAEMYRKRLHRQR